MTLSTNAEAILSVYKLATVSEQQHGVTWYPQARSIAKGIADRYDIHEAEAIGVIAALSPRNKWERNVIDAENLVAAFVAGGAEAAEAVKVCTFGKNKAKAVRILQAGVLTDADVLEILSGPKLREFYSCIRGLADVCIDGHAYSIWTGGRIPLAEVPSIGVKIRRQIKADYVAAADQAGVTPSAMQAITWVTWRRIHGVA